MAINNINNNLNNSNIGKTQKVQSNKASESSRVSNQEFQNSSQNVNHASKDSVSITHAKYGNEIQFAQQVLKNLNKASLHNLKRIKVNIENKDYDKTHIQKAVGNKIQASLNALQSSNVNNHQQIKIDADGDHDGDTSSIADHD